MHNIMPNNEINLKNKSSLNSYRNIFINSPNIRPIKSLAESPIHGKLKDYFHINGYNSINEFEGYLWQSILRGRHVLAVSASDIDSELNYTIRKRKQKVITFFSPVLTLMLQIVERENELTKEKLPAQSEIRKNYEFKRKNGPRLLIVCSSCKNAQRIYEFISSVIINDKNLLKVILLQGGANDKTYDVKLSNGCDVLICATPYCLLRMLGNGNTNLERLEFFTIDEANIVLEKYPKQMKTLMDIYANLLKIEVRQKIAQFILFSSTWSDKLKEFVSLYFMDETILFESKLEASYFGNVNHIVHEVKSISSKVEKLIELIEMNKKYSILIFINENVSAQKLFSYLRKKGYYTQLIDDQTNENDASLISNEWSESSSSKQLILICSQSTLTFLNIRNASCVIHFDFPQSKRIFSERLWVMSHNFKMIKNGSNTLMEGSGDVSVDASKWMELQSHIFFAKEDVEFSEGLLKYLQRIGIDKVGLPKILIDTASERLVIKEGKQNQRPLCPLTKSYGECLSLLSNCEYRHRLDENIDRLRVLSEGGETSKQVHVPSDGYVKFKIAHIRETNHCFIHLLNNQVRLENGDIENVDYDFFSNLDLEMQLYFSNLQNRNGLSKFNKKKLYAFKDVETTIFKRVRIIDVIDEENKIAYKILVECIDYGAQVIIDSKDLIELPKEFTLLPPQAVEIYFCDIRPVDRDINWSIASKLFISEKLSKSKEFFGKIQLAAGNILWLHPVSSQKKLDSVNLKVVDDCIRRDLVENNYGVLNADHLIKLKKLFEESNFPIPSTEEVEAKCEIVQLNQVKPEYAFLDKDAEFNHVQVSVVSTASKIYVQKTNSFTSLEDLNKDLNKFIEKNENNEEFLKLKSSLISTINKYKNNVDLLSSCYCLAKFETYYCRAQVVEVQEENEKIRVFFVDYGDEAKVLMNEIYPVEDKFLAKLPFQAIFCSIEDLDPPISLSKSVQEWEYDVGDFIWSKTHDAENFHHKVLATVKKEVAQGPYSKHRSYVVDLFRFNLPIPINISNMLVASGMSMLSEARSSELFPFIQKSKYNSEKSENLNIINNLSKLSVNNFVKERDEAKQMDFINFLKTRLINVDKIEENDMINSGLIQTIAQCIYFIGEKKCLTNIFQFMKKRFFNNDKFIASFCDHNGLSNILLVLIEYLNSEESNLVNTSFECLKQLISREVVQERILTASNSFRAFWYLLKSCRNIEIFERVLELLDYLSKVEKINYKLASADYEYAKKIINRIESNFETDNLLNILERFSKRLDSNDTLSKNVAKLLANVPTSTVKALVDAGTKEMESHSADKNNNYINDDDDNSSHSTDSSYFEVNQQFEKDLMNLMMLANSTENHNVPNSEFNDVDMWISKEYLYPKLVWDQTNSLITLKVLLEHVKEFELSYLETSIRFRTEIKDNKYGFDFDLYANISPNECSANTKTEMLIIVLKKKVDGIWPRFLNKLNKPKFLSSIYDNTKDADDENIIFKTECENKETKHIPSFIDDPLLDKNDESEHENHSDSESPINSDFEDDIPRDDKDIYWE